MSGKDYLNFQEMPKLSRNTWEEEIKRLKHDIKKTENRIIMTEKRRKLFDKARFEIDLQTTDTEPIDSENKYPEPYCLENVERVIPGRQLVPGGSKAFRVVDKPATPPMQMKKESDSESNAHQSFWVSPSSIMRKRPKENPTAEWVKFDFPIQELSPESPKRIRSSPSERTERNQNREWLSPHRVIDRPNPENSHGNWVSMRGIHQRVLHSPVEDELLVNEIREEGDQPNRPFSQSTYTIRRNLFTPDTQKSEDLPVARKTTVLKDFEPDLHDAAPKRRGENIFAPCHMITSNENMKRIVRPDGHIVKVSTLGDISVGITHSKNEDTTKIASKAPEAVEARNSKGTSMKKVVMKDIKEPITYSSPRKCRGVRKPSERKTPPIRPKEEPQNDKENKPKSGDEQNEDADNVISELKKIFGDQKNENESCAKRKSVCDKKRNVRQEEYAKRAKTSFEEKKQEVKNRRRDVDMNAVQKYIKLQKIRRMENLRSEREKKAAEEEAKKKKLEELRIKTLQLAASSKKKISEMAQVSTIKIIEPEAETEEDMTVSLGLKQTKPKVSYNESILNLKKKTNRAEQMKCDTVTKSLEPDIQKDTEHEEKEIINLSSPNAFMATKLESSKVDIEKNTNLALKRLAETLQLTLQQQKKPEIVRSSASALHRIPDTNVSNEEHSFAKQNNQRVITIDMETIKSLKHDIKKISEDFQVLHEIIIDKPRNPTSAKEVLPEVISSCKLSQLSSVSGVNSKQNILGQIDEAFPSWLRNIILTPHPYNVLTAVKNKMKINHKTLVSDKEVSDDATFSAFLKDKCESDSDTVPTTTNQQSSTDETDLIGWSDSKTEQTTSEDKYYSFRDDSGSELSSSILDSEKHRSFNRLETLKKPTDFLKLDNAAKNTPKSSAIEDTTSISLDRMTSDNRTLKDSKENLLLIPSSVQLVSNIQGKPSESRSILKSPALSLSLNAKCCSSTISEEKPEKNVENNNAQATDIEEIITESVRSSSVKVDSTVTRLNEVCVTRSFFNPEALHVQFQAELTLLETFQRSLAHFLELERMKALSHAEKSKSDRAVNTENILEEEMSARESYTEASSHDEETESVKTELEIVKLEDGTAEESAKTESDGNDQKSMATEAESEKSSCGGDNNAGDSVASKKKNFDLSDSTTGISLQMLNRMVKDEELRSEHQLALIRLREKTLNEKVKAELTFLEIRKKALKEKGGEEEQAISAIKKKQRGILLKYQSEKEDIERLKKMHKIASEERKIMIKQQKQIQKMQLSTKDMLIKLKKREKSPQKRIPIKLKAFKYYDSQSDLQEDISINASDNFTDSVTSLDESNNRSIESDIDVTSKNNISDGGDEILKRNMKMLEEKISKSVEKSAKIGGNSDPRKHLKRGYSADELLKWTKRLEEKENWLKEMENQVGSLFHISKHKTFKSYKDAKISMRDRSTSPFQFQEIVKSICETSPSLTEVIEVKNSSSIAELIEGNSKTEDVEEMAGKVAELVPEKHPTSASEDIQEEFSKNTTVVSRSVEYNSESFESPSSSDTHKSKPVAVKSKSSEHNSLGNGIMIKMALSPRVHDTRRRYSSGSDESVNLFQTETASEQSDVEIRIAALHEQLRCRKLEAERLRREQKRAHRERLKAKEQSLIKQIEAYDSYIQKKKQELQQEYERTSPTFVRPIVRQPKISEKVSLKRSELSCEDEWKTNIQTKLTLRKKELDAVPVDKSTSGNDKESDSEIVENIKTLTEDESIKEETMRKDIVSTIISDNVSASKRNVSDSTTSSMLESLPMQSASIDGSYSESEDQTETNVSVKTTLLSPEKPDLEISETTMKTDMVDIEGFSPSEEKVEASSKEVTEIMEEIKYSNESFESDKSFTKKSEAPSATELVSEESKASSELICTIDDATNKKETTRDEVSYEKTEYTVEGKEDESFEAEKEIKEEMTFKEEKKMEITLESSVISECSEKLDGDTDQITDVDEAVEVNAKMADFIAESILGDLMSESLKVVIGKAHQTKRAEECTSFIHSIIGSKVDVITNSLAAEMISEVIDDALRKYNRKKRSGNEEDVGGSSVHRRVIEIMSQAPTVKREHRRPQDLMVTTYDLPAGITAGQELAWSEREEFLQSLSPTKDKSVKIEINNLDIPVQHSKADAYGQEWFDDDFGLSRTRREAEELRLQQLQIEQEIQQLQAQQEQVPYYYLRQIPNKPPPPYTPPGTATAERFTSEAEITSVTSMAVRFLSDELHSGKHFSEIEAPATFFGASDNDHVKCYKVFLFDLAKHILSETISVGDVQEEKLPWMRTSEKLSKYKMKKVERTFECLLEVVMKQVLVLFGFRQKMGKERLIVRWSRKKRDHVDEILVGESQEEESEWTHYDEDEVTVKNNVTIGILDSLLDEMAHILNAIWLKKRKKTD